MLIPDFLLTEEIPAELLFVLYISASIISIYASFVFYKAGRTGMALAMLGLGLGSMSAAWFFHYVTTTNIEAKHVEQTINLSRWIRLVNGLAVFNTGLTALTEVNASGRLGKRISELNAGRRHDQS